MRSWWKLLQYELKGVWRIGLILTGIYAVWILFLIYLAYTWEAVPPFIFFFLSNVGVSFLIFIFGIQLFSQEMNRGTGYLLYSLPVSGYSITGAKIAMALFTTIYFAALAIIGYGIIAKSITALLPEELSQRMSLIPPADFFLHNFTLLLSGFLWTLLSLLILWLLIALSMLISRMIFYKRKVRFLGTVVTFFLLSWLNGTISSALARLFPTHLQLNPDLSMINNLHFDSSLIAFPVFQPIYDMLIFLLLFIAVSQLLEKRMEV